MTPKRSTIRHNDNVEVNRLGYGAMWLTGAGIWGPPPSPREARTLLTKVLDVGINFIDTADSYGPHSNEELIADALHPYPKDLIIGTKAGLIRPGPDRWERNGHPEHLRAACEGSLRRLKLDSLHLCQLHAPDPSIPFADSVGALARLQEEGKIALIGLSNVSPEQLRQARELTEIASVQNRFNIEDQAHRPVLDECESRGIAFIPWGPMPKSATTANLEIANIARDFGLTATQAALAWTLLSSPVTLPIPGTSSIMHLEQNVAAATAVLAQRS